MGHSEEADGNISHLDAVSVLDDFEIDRRKMREFALSLLDHERVEVSGVHRRITDAIHYERNSTYVIEVSV